MTAYEKAKAVFDMSDPRNGISFEEAMEAHLQHGFVVSRPDVFVMFRPVPYDAPTEQIVDPWHVFHGRLDCWHVYVCAGNMAKAWEFCPVELPWISYERRKFLHVRAFCTMLQKTYK